MFITITFCDTIRPKRHMGEVLRYEKIHYLLDMRA